MTSFHQKIFDIDEDMGMQRCAKHCSFSVLGSHKKAKLTENSLHERQSQIFSLSYHPTSTMCRSIFLEIIWLTTCPTNDPFVRFYPKSVKNIILRLSP